VALGFLGVALGWALGSMETIEAARGQWAAWILIALGFTYGAWGVHRALRNRPHGHLHRHADGTAHTHEHSHHHDHSHVHPEPGKPSLTPWVLFVAFVLGPCEPLIPLLMVPALSHGYLQLALTVTVFGAATIVTMLSSVWILQRGASLLPIQSVERWNHALAGFAVFACGGAMAWLGL
jgi:sulfite exporter TauE/SafE